MSHNSASNVIAGAATVSPVWLPSLQQASEIAGLVLPLLGVTWLLIQITGYLWKVYKEKRK